jgi:hypothetical protein
MYVSFYCKINCFLLDNLARFLAECVCSQPCGGGECERVTEYDGECPPVTNVEACNTDVCRTDCQLSSDVIERLKLPSPCNATCGDDGWQLVGRYALEQEAQVMIVGATGVYVLLA